MMKLIGIEGTGYQKTDLIRYGAAVLLREDGRIVNGCTGGIDNKLTRENIGQEAVTLLSTACDVFDDTAFAAALSNSLLDYFPLKEIIDGLGATAIFGDEYLVVTFSHEERESRAFSKALGKFLVDNLHRGRNWPALVEPVSYLGVRNPHVWACKVHLDPAFMEMGVHIMAAESLPVFEESLDTLRRNHASADH